MRIVENWVNILVSRFAAARVVDVFTFITSPPIVDPFRFTCFSEINLFFYALSHIGNPHIMREAVKTPSKWIAQTECPDFIGDQGIIDKRIVRRNGIVYWGPGLSTSIRSILPNKTFPF